MPKFSIHTLGCKVNSYESQGYIKGLKSLGYEEVSENEVSDICIVNTCSVTNTAASKSRQKINHMRNLNPNALICAVGCYIQTEKSLDKLNVDVLVGCKDKNKLPELVDDAYRNKIKINNVSSMEKAEFEAIEIDNFEHKTRAFIKVQDGCNQFCSYCIIPYARGRQRSMPIDEVIEQCKKLAKSHKEIVLTGIHTGRYGEDIGTNLLALLKEIVKVDGIQRVRLSSIEINELSDELIDFIASEEKMANHLHIPVQSCCNRTLKMMNRPYTIEYFIERINYIREKLDNVSISTDIILGFPDESEDDFKTTLDNLAKINFSFMHIFPFSKRDGTKACDIPNHLPNTIKKERCKKVNEISEKGYLKYKKGLLNKNLAVLFEYYKDGYLFGHTSEYVMVKCKGDKELVNTINNVNLLAIENDVLIGEMR